jgi:hypothetical protein
LQSSSQVEGNAVRESHVAVGNALQQLENVGVLQRLNERKWGRVWECDEILDLVAEFEQGVSTP